MNKPNGISDKVWEMAYEVNHSLWALIADDPDDKRFWQDTRTIALAISKAIEETYETCAKMLEEGYDKEVYEPYREDGRPSKNDRCKHGRALYEDCEMCAAKAIRTLSKGQE